MRLEGSDLLKDNTIIKLYIPVFTGGCRRGLLEAYVWMYSNHALTPRSVISIYFHALIPI
jgi:hypothetical protein